MPLDINWFFIVDKFCKIEFSFWNSLLKAWRNVRCGLIKFERPTILDENFKQPLFGNSHIPQLVFEELNTSVHVGKTMFIARCTCIRDLWNSIIHNWKELKYLSIRHITTSFATHNNLMMNIPWDPGVVPLEIVSSD
jgi:hypothetical protein